MQYLTYERYLAVDGSCDSATFDRYKVKAFAVVDYNTHNRVSAMATIPIEVETLCRDLIELYARNSTSDKVVSSISKSAGTVSQSESYAVKTDADIKDITDSLVCDYLLSVTDDNGVPLLYRGCADES